MDIQTEKIELAKRILNTENPRIIESIKNIFETEGPGDFWDKLTPAQQQEIQQATTEIEQGEVIDYETLMSKHR